MKLVKLVDSLPEPEGSPDKIPGAQSIPYTITAKLCIPRNLKDYSRQ